MKKIILTLSFFCITTISMFCSTPMFSTNGFRMNAMRDNDIARLMQNQQQMMKDYNFSINHEQLGCNLSLDADDTLGNATVYIIYDRFCDGMIRASETESSKRQTRLTLNSIDYAVKNMRYLLNDYQYHMFLQYFHNKLMSNGFGEEVDKYCERSRE